MRRQRFKRAGEAIIGPVGVREPVPVLKVSMVACGQRDAVAEKQGAESLWPLGGLIGVRHGFHPGQGQRKPGATEKCASIEFPGGAGHGGFPWAGSILWSAIPVLRSLTNAVD